MNISLRSWWMWMIFNYVIDNFVASSAFKPGEYHILPFHAIPSIIAINMILAAATGGIVAVCIASWAQVR